MFKSSYGIDANYNDREYGFCAHGINTNDKIFMIPDTLSDIRFNDHPMVLGDPKIRFYAGVPLINPSGFVLGTLCVIDQSPRVLNDAQINALEILSNQIINLLELRKKNAELLIAQKKVEEYASQMEDFAYMASHDLKEPTRMINLFLSKLQNKYQNLFDDKAHQYLNFAQDGAKRMALLIDEILSFAKLDTLSHTKEHLKVPEVIEEIIAFQLQNIERPTLKIKYQDFPEVYSSRTAIKIILQNLIANAIKYQHPNNLPEVEVSITQQNNFWQFAVKDNGIGIEEEYFESIFKIFKRLHSKNEYIGSGLGLSMCKKIVHHLGGDIWLTSKPNMGSIFYFTIPK